MIPNPQIKHKKGFFCYQIFEKGIETVKLVAVFLFSL